MVDRPLTDYEKLRAEIVVALLPIVTKRTFTFAEAAEYEALDSAEQQDIWAWRHDAVAAVVAADIVLDELFKEKS